MVKMPILLKAIQRANTIKLPMAFFTELEPKKEKNFDLCGNTKDHEIAKAIPRKKKGAGRMEPP